MTLAVAVIALGRHVVHVDAAHLNGLASIGIAAVIAALMVGYSVARRIDPAHSASVPQSDTDRATETAKQAISDPYKQRHEGIMEMSTTGTRKPLIHAILFASLSLVGLSAQAQTSEGHDWQWMVAPYAWGVSFDTDLERTEPPAGGISNDTGFDDVLDKFDGAFQVHVEGQADHWGVFADFTYLGLADEQDRPRFRTETDLDARLFEIAGVWSPDDERYKGLDVFAGLRYIDVDMTVNFDPVDPAFGTTVFDGSQSFSDFMVGARYTWALSDRWGVTLRGDGSFGDTEGTWNASAVANFRMKHGAWLFGYRYLSVELETGDTNTDLTMSGPMIGYGFVF